jgi:hypothetical protein
MKMFLTALLLLCAGPAWAQDPLSLEWTVGQSPQGGVLLVSVPGPYVVTALWCEIDVVGDSGATIDVYAAPSGTGGTDGLKLSAMPCDLSIGAEEQAMLRDAAPTIPAENSVYLVVSGSFQNSAGSIRMRVEPAAEGRAL